MTSCSNLVYQKTVIDYINPSIMTEVNVSVTVGLSATVGECLQQWGNVCDSWGNVCNSGEIEYDLGNLTVEMAIHNCA